MFDGNFNQELLLLLNSYAGANINIWNVATNALLRGFPIFFAIVSLWFLGDCKDRRGRMSAGLFAVCLATVLSFWLQVHFKVNVRPLLDPSLRLMVAKPEWTTLAFWGHASSFPSDTATLFFGLSTVIFLENRLIGLFCFLWAAVVVAVPRVIFGWHYPSDIVGAAILGPGCVVVFSKLPYLRTGFERVLAIFEGRMYLVHASLFIFLADAYNLFASLQGIGKQFAKILHL
jgi:membrane-associated phospholipid phosphatase